VFVIVCRTLSVVFFVLQEFLLEGL